MRNIFFQDTKDAICIGSEKKMQRVMKAEAIKHGKPFITIDRRHIDERISAWDGEHLQKWIEFSEALDHLIDAGEIYCAILTERNEDESK